ncbi:class I SAM-dependent methyltransferase [bacterium]|nr:class I SAM-dependent methyltransferase [bacterium]
MQQKTHSVPRIVPTPSRKVESAHDDEHPTTSHPATSHLDTAHPDYPRWKRAAENAVLRGSLVCRLLSEAIPLREARVLDAGCGVGGTSIALADAGADVTAVDRNPARLTMLQENQSRIEAEAGDLTSLRFADRSFDAAVLQDVIEHVTDPQLVLREMARVLRPSGILYLSTPNRNALPNLVADPHFGLPLVSRKSREELRPILRRRRPSDADRDDLAQLLSAEQLSALLGNAGFSWRYVNRAAAKQLFTHPETVVWSDMHLRIVRALRATGLQYPLRVLVRDTPGIFNRWLNPTWYILARKEGA